MSIAVSPDSSTLLTGHEDGSVKIWNVESRELEAQFPWSWKRGNLPRVFPRPAICLHRRVMTVRLKSGIRSNAVRSAR